MNRQSSEDWGGSFLAQLNQLRSFNEADPEVRFLKYCCENLHLAKSQLLQDLFVLFILKDMERGYFVEFGACDGVLLSNTLMLEKSKGWSGILAEPVASWHEALAANRRCLIDHRCVFSESRLEVSFKETPIREISSMEEFAYKDMNAGARRQGDLYTVETVSLNDLLSHHHAPRRINYMSIDTEGSELRILESFDFSRHVVDVWTIEHNFTQDRQAIRDLMDNNGYLNVFPNLSGVDDWFVRAGVWPA